MKNKNRFLMPNTSMVFSIILTLATAFTCISNALGMPQTEEEDYGDAPENASGKYPTTSAFNGARHIILPGIFLGSMVDPEPDGQPGVNADCDDSDCIHPSFGDDEDGVTIPVSVSKGSTVSIIVSASVNGFLDAWMDFNLDKDWTDAGEHIFTNTPLTAGSNTLSFTVPASAATGISYARFRFRDYSESISFDGLVLNGEVEDYKVNITTSAPGNLDFGDAPDPAYPTLLANNGARHTIVAGIFLGSKVDPETNGQPNVSANCDDNDCLFPSLGDDEDGVIMASSVTTSTTVGITVTASANGFLDAWMDFTLNGNWADAGEHIFTNNSLVAGVNTLTFNVPANATVGQSYVRFRFRTVNGNISFNGLVANGEVEDYTVFIQEADPEYDFGDAPENASGNYPTTLAFNGARHTYVPGIHLGSMVDPEPDGQPSINADCDDSDCIHPSFGDDEDGVNIPASVSKGSSVSITIVASVTGYLDAWMDFNLDQDWADAGEHIFTSTPLVAGANTLTFNVPTNATTGQSFARFRFRDYNGTISYNSLVLNGEVEDYKVNITASSPGNLDFGDAPDPSYPTLLANNGARHTIVAGIFLGNKIDPETNGQPNVSANCDDNDCLAPSLGDDEDGVIIAASVTKGTNVTITVTASVNGFLDGWMDFNLNGSWSEAGEHIFTNNSLLAGVNTLTFNVPANATVGQSYVRFRFRTVNGSISFNGLVANGEVEDYTVFIQEADPEYDFGDAPENATGNYPTTLAFNGARHTYVQGIYLGSMVDPEPDGQPGINADCDDSDCIHPSFGDDEDGVNIPASVSKGSTVSIIVSASVNGFLDAWMDFNLDKDWTDAGEHIFTNTPLVTGSNTLSIAVPAAASTGQSYARFRFRDYNGTIGYNGLVLNGEVEDYSVNIVLSNFKVDINVIIGGAFNPGSGMMNTGLNALNLLPLQQPYNNPAAVWSYTGTESVASIPQTSIIDWIVIELRETNGGPVTATGATTIAKQAVFLLSDGSIRALDGLTLPAVNHIITGNLYVVVWHRNHLGIMSANPMSFDGIDTYSYNFSSGPSQAYGSNAQIEIVPGIYGMIPGDALPDGQINSLDKTNKWMMQAGKTGYLESDFNLNGQVNNVDKNNFCLPSLGKGSFVP